jgi:hypothetical protein
MESKEVMEIVTLDLDEKHWTIVGDLGFDHSLFVFAFQVTHVETLSNRVLVASSSHEVSVVCWCWVRHRTVAASEEMTQILNRIGRKCQLHYKRTRND